MQHAELTPERWSRFGVDQQVLMIANGDSHKIGAPTVAGGKVTAEVVSHGRGDKIRIIKHRRRKNSHKEQGHRQNYTEVRIDDIVQG